MEGENKTQPRIIRGDFNDQELVIFLKGLAEKLETREYLKKRPEELRAKIDAVEAELARMSSDVDLFVVDYSEVAEKRNEHGDKSRGANSEELLSIAESAIKEMKKAASDKGLDISRQEIQLIRLIRTALGISGLIV
ncbi:hypothetical protein J8655_12845 [Dickeya oryzae]|uniref:Uncharacterized protein n=1 Tax=Dickeya oryzae TaxID=1240404 RepID=A0AB39ITE1_9GAMM|nr:hypothetical protein [Dickeya oryzae]MBP2846366.1 hypothetical protein [Dickeya oryzae]MCA6992697.1 hypothetical protein [Dickeya oryzae]